MKQALFRMLSGLVLACLVVPRPSFAATDTVPFSAFGYRDTILERGPNASLAVFVPLSRGVRSIRLHAPITISPLVDPRSSIVVTANDIPVASLTVKTAGLHPTIDVPIPIPPAARSLSVAIVGRLFINGDICSPPPQDGIYFTVSQDSRLIVDGTPSPSNDQVADFLNQYGGDFVVVNKAGGDDARTATMQLAYRLHQIERWRRVDVHVAGDAPAAARRVVVGTFPTDLAVHGNELDATPHGVSLLDDRITRLMITPNVSGATFDPSGANDKMISIDQLGVTTRTLRGSGELPFDIPVTYGAFGGVPQHLRLHVDLAHTPVRPADRAYVQVLVNNTLIGAYDMTGKNNVERFDVPLDVDAVSSSNVVRVVPTFYFERDGCKGNYPSFTATLANDTNFQWDGISHRMLSVGDFIRAVSGKVALLIDDPARDGAAFALVNAIGTVNADVKSIDVKPFDGSIPSGYDYAMVVGAADKVASLKPPLDANGQAFTIFAEDGTTVRYKADYSAPFGVLQTTQPGGTPTLVMTYWKDPSVLAGIARMQPDDLAAQTDNVMVFNSREGTYTRTDRPVPSHEDSLALSIPLIIGLFILLLIVVVVLASRRKA